MAQLQRYRKPGNDGHGGRECGYPQMGVRAVLKAQKIPAHRARIADQPMGPHQDALPFRGETLEAGCALHQRSVEHLLETLDSKRQRRLSNATTFCSAA